MIYALLSGGTIHNPKHTSEMTDKNSVDILTTKYFSSSDPLTVAQKTKTDQKNPRFCLVYLQER